MRILYGINTNGQGHINRASSIVRQLIDEGHQVDLVFAGPQPPEYAKLISKHWMNVLGYKLIFIGKYLDMPGTVIHNIGRLTFFPRDLKNIVQKARKLNYDLILSDFDHYTSLTGKVLGVPVISVDHQHSLIHKNALLPPDKWFERIAAQTAVHLTMPYRNHFIAIDFTDKIYSDSKGTLFPLVYKTDFEPFTISTNEHYTVYFYSWSPKELIELFILYPDEQFHVFGYNVEFQYRNIIFKKTSRSGFLKDMTTSKGIISQAGFSLNWEAAQINKPIYTIPQPHQYEQYTNAYRMQENGLGYFASTLNKADLDRFIEFTKGINYQTKHKLPILDVGDLTKTIMQVYDKINHKF